VTSGVWISLLLRVGAGVVETMTSLRVCLVEEGMEERAFARWVRLLGVRVI
jgi:hypothetical protein